MDELHPKRRPAVDSTSGEFSRWESCLLVLLAVAFMLVSMIPLLLLGMTDQL